MLNGLLEKSTCAECRICCAFDRYDVWETPIITPDILDDLKEYSPKTEVCKRGNAYSFKIKDLVGDELFYCPLLDHEKGCVLGDRKPFDCRIWPFRVMDFNGQRVVTISPLCSSVIDQPLSAILKFLKENLLDEIKKYADTYPEAVKPYDNLYPVLMTI